MTASSWNLMIDAFGDDDSCDPEFCVGNSHALIKYDITDTTAMCVCGNTLTSTDGQRYVHDVNGRVLCPPYNCQHCGHRHHEPPVFTMSGVQDGHRISRTARSRQHLDRLAEIVLSQGWTDIEARDGDGADITFSILAFCAA